VPANYHIFTSVAAPPQAAPQPSSVVYPPAKVQPVSEIMDQMNQLKCVVSDFKLGFSDLKIWNNETRHQLGEHRGQLTEIMDEISYRKKPKKNKGLCM
jgi:hypothetical protein